MINSSTSVSVGIAYSSYVPELLNSYPGSIDFVEIPYEQIRHAPEVLAISSDLPVILHCASLSVAGAVLPSDDTVAEIARLVDITKTPWIGEHLSFVTAENSQGGHSHEQCYPNAPFNIGYSVSPPQDESSLALVDRAFERLRERFSVPLILENPPLYFPIPGSTMTQSEFINRVCVSTGCSLLLDLAHFFITCNTFGLVPLQEIDALPLERVMEVHLSGVRPDSGVTWDDHASPTPDILFTLLGRVLSRASLKAVTIEHNWDGHYPLSVLMKEIEQTRTLLS